MVVTQINSTNLPPDVRDDALFTAHTARDAISSWKSHQLRMVHQDIARTDILETLENNSVLIVQDYAMKFMPTQYRETQKEFFGKRGISWHVTVCQTKVNGKLQAQTFVHIVKSGVQESETVVPIMEHIMQTLKKEHPEIQNVYYRQDNAGCYHSATTILSCEVLRERSGLNLCQLDFCDPQGGKGPCDRKAAQIKCHIKAYINQGNSVTTPEEMKTAIQSNGGIPGVRVACVPGATRADSIKAKWDGISAYYNFKFTKDGVRVFKAYSIGNGKFSPWSKFHSKLLFY